MVETLARCGVLAAQHRGYRPLVARRYACHSAAIALAFGSRCPAARGARALEVGCARRVSDEQAAVGAACRRARAARLSYDGVSKSARTESARVGGRWPSRWPATREHGRARCTRELCTRQPSQRMVDLRNDLSSAPSGLTLPRLECTEPPNPPCSEQLPSCS